MQQDNLLQDAEGITMTCSQTDWNMDCIAFVACCLTVLLDAMLHTWRTVFAVVVLQNITF